MEELIKKILQGAPGALEELVKKIQPDVFNISLRFLWLRQDAEDATQEILIKVITNLSKFEGKSQVSTWVYRIAVNHLMNFRKSQLESKLDFSYFGSDIEKGLQSPSYEGADKQLLAEEVKIGCTLGMLLCLSREHRIAYILAEVFELDSREGAKILDTTAPNFRKRVSLAKQRLSAFLGGHCGLVKTSNQCRCHKRIQYAIDENRVNRNALQFVTQKDLIASNNEMEKLYDVTGLYRSHPTFRHFNASVITELLKTSPNILTSGR